MFNKKVEKIHRHTNEREYIEFLREIEKEYPGDPLSQVNCALESKNPKIALMILSRVAHDSLQAPKGNVTISSGQLAYIYSAILDLTAHTQLNLPNGVYEYSLSNLKGVTAYILEEAQENERNKKIYLELNSISFFEDDLYFETILSHSTDQEVITFAAELLKRGLNTINALSSGISVNKQEAQTWIISKISKDLESLPLLIAQKKYNQLREALVNPLCFIKKVDVTLIENSSLLEHYKDIMKHFPEMFN